MRNVCVRHAPIAAEKKKIDALVSLEDLAGLREQIDLPVRVDPSGLEELIGRFSEQDAFAPAVGHGSRSGQRREGEGRRGDVASPAVALRDGLVGGTAAIQAFPEGSRRTGEQQTQLYYLCRSNPRILVPLTRSLLLFSFYFLIAHSTKLAVTFPCAFENIAVILSCELSHGWFTAQELPPRSASGSTNGNRLQSRRPTSVLVRFSIDLFRAFRLSAPVDR